MHDTSIANELMRQQSFLRDLARELVRDAHLADDLVQQTNISALERADVRLLHQIVGEMRVAHQLAREVAQEALLAHQFVCDGRVVHGFAAVAPLVRRQRREGAGI